MPDDMVDNHILAPFFFPLMPPHTELLTVGHTIRPDNLSSQVIPVIIMSFFYKLALFS